MLSFPIAAKKRKRHGQEVHPSGLRDAAENTRTGASGSERQIGTLNFTTRGHRRGDAPLQEGKVISLALNFDHLGPQAPRANIRRWAASIRSTPWLRTGTDAYSGVLDKRGHPRRRRHGGECRCSAARSGMGSGHIFYENYMWNGYDCREGDVGRRARSAASRRPRQDGRRGGAARRCALQRRRLARRRLRITCQDLDETARSRASPSKRGDFSSFAPAR